MTELPREAFLPSGSLDSRIHGHGFGHGRGGGPHRGVMPGRAGCDKYANASSMTSSPLPPPYPPHQQPTSSVATTSHAGIYALPPSTLPPPSSELFAQSLPLRFERSSSLSPFARQAPHHFLDAPGPHRSASLSPTNTAGGAGGPPPSSSQPTSLFSGAAPADPPGALLSRSASADAAAPQQSSVHLVQRLTQQNSLIRDAWEAERNYLEANRRRAEEVYQEERTIMMDVREGWESEKAQMLEEIQALKERIQRLEGENATLKAVTGQSAQVSDVASPLASQPSGSRGVSTESSSSLSGPEGSAAHRASAIPSQQNNGPVTDVASLPPGLDGASRRPHFASPGAPHMSPNLQPEPSPFVPLDPRMQPRTGSRDFLSSPSEDEDTPIPVIDVKEIDPKLEGIPIRATAVQRSTFAEASDKSSPATSPPARENGQADRLAPGLVKRVSSKDHTVQVLAVEESRRRTMHAGHTPNHSLSLFPGLSTSRGGSDAAGQSEGTTPTATGFSAPPEKQDGVKEDGDDGEEDTGASAQAGPEEPHQGEAVDEPEATLEPEDDVPLKGPLMVKNIPAQDEIFWETVNKKLETLSHDQNSLPTVMQVAEELESAAGPSGKDTLPQRQGVVVAAAVGGDGSHDAQAEGDAAENGGKSVEGELPLKLRSTTNFGAPFGVM